jgi:hypothetical protein
MFAKTSSSLSKNAYFCENIFEIRTSVPEMIMLSEVAYILEATLPMKPALITAPIFSSVSHRPWSFLPRPDPRLTNALFEVKHTYTIKIGQLASTILTN